VLLEAMAGEKPVVATDRGGVPEIVRHGETGLLVPPLAPPALASAVIRILQDRQLATRLGRNGRARVEQHFTIDLMVRRTTELYRSLLCQDENAPATQQARL